MYKRLTSYLPNLAESWLLTAVLAIGGSLLAVALNLTVTAFFPGFRGWGELITYPVIFIPVFLVIIYNNSYKRGISQKRASELTAASDEEPGFGSIGAPLTFALILPLVFAFNIVTEPIYSWMEVPSFMKELLSQVQSNKISGFLAIVVFAPILEELFCRGIILKGLLHHTTPIKAILWSSVMFGVMHLNPWQALPAFILGLLMGWIYYRTKSLWSVIFIHFINNAFSYFVTILFPELPADTGFFDLIPGSFYYYVYFLALIFVIGVLYIMNSYYDKTISSEIQSNT